MLRGREAAKIDDKGRLKVPAAFRSIMASRWGSTLFVTTYMGDSALVYPLPVWEKTEQRLRSALPAEDPDWRSLRLDTNFYGNQTDFDRQGRVLISGPLREKAGIVGMVDVFGQYDHLEVWNHDRYLSWRKQNPVTPGVLSKIAAASARPGATGENVSEGS